MHIMIYACVFAGRRDRLVYTIRWLRVALSRGLIHEVHLWKFVRDPDDEGFVDAFRDVPGIRIFAGAGRDTYDRAYAFYECLSDSDILLKVDDDVIWADVDALEDFLEHRLTSDALMVSANVINNPVCHVIQRKLVPEEHRPPECADLLTDGRQALAVHRHFGEDPRRARIGNLITLHPGVRLNINCVAFLGRDKFLLSECHDPAGNSDEENLSVHYPRRFGRTVEIYGNFVAVHLSFHTQEETLRPHVPEVLTKYASHLVAAP